MSLRAAFLLCVLAALTAAQEGPPDSSPEKAGRSATGETAATASWWSLAPLRAPTVPGSHAGHPIDTFVDARLLTRGLERNPPADRRTLLRRATFDLHGLPPTPGELDTFLADQAPGAWERLVDRLLASPRYGERQARHWLDVVHYGDSHGYDKDKPRRHAWPYRDYVIRAFNEDRPWGRFVQEQIAGDVSWPASPDGVVATGFLAAGPWDYVGHVELREGTAAKAEVRNLDRDDMVMTAMATFASTTVHCARCHDHEFDPIPQADYYALQAVFAGVERADREYEPDATVAARRRELKAREERLGARAREIRREIEGRDDPSAAVEAAAIASVRKQAEALPTKASPTLGWHSGIHRAPNTVTWVQLDLGTPHSIESITLVPAHVVYGGHPGPAFGFPVRFHVDVANRSDFEDARRVIDRTTSDVPSPRNAWVPFELDGVNARFVRITATRLFERTKDWIFALGEVRVTSGGTNVARGAVITSADSVEAAPSWGRRNLIDGYDSRVAIDSSDRVALEERYARLLAAEVDRREAALPPDLRARRDEGAAALERTRRDLATLPPPATVYAAATDFKAEGQFRPSGSPRTIHVLERGDLRRKKEIARPGTLSAVANLASRFDADSEGARRVALARWLTHRDNPLSWRSGVNRLWQHHFGVGLVATPNDFGRMGQPPSHPELLDWLATHFRDAGGSMKALHRLIMTSETYRQTATIREEAALLDADNRLLWRMNRRRLEAEAIRDTMLAVSGRLDLRMGGPAERHFAFKNDHSPVYDFGGLPMTAPTTRQRRSIYRFIVRSTPDPFFESLDCADPSLLVPQRQVTLTAPQALAMLNNRLTLDCAAALAARLDATPGSTRERIARAVRLVYSREATAPELELLGAYSRRHGLARTCRILFNANEFVFVD